MYWHAIRVTGMVRCSQHCQKCPGYEHAQLKLFDMQLYTVTRAGGTGLVAPVLAGPIFKALTIYFLLKPKKYLQKR